MPRGPAGLLRVMEVQREGRRMYLLLRCGHLRLHNPRVAVPARAHCQECAIAAS